MTRRRRLLSVPCFGDNATVRAAIAFLLLGAVAIAKPPEGDDLVDVRPLLPRARFDIRYATRDNFTHEKIYPAARCFLRRAVALRLARVQADLETRGLGLKL